MTRTRNTPLFDATMAWSLDLSLSSSSRYLVATIVIVFVALVRATLITSLLPWLLFIPAILLIALILGQTPGIFSSVLSALLAGLSIGSLSQPLYLTGPQWGGSILFVVIAIGIVLVAGQLRAALRRARATNADLQERESFQASVLASSTDCIAVLDLDGRMTFMTEGGMAAMDVGDFADVRGSLWPDIWRGTGPNEAREAIGRARHGLASQFIAPADTFGGIPKWWNVSVTPIPGSDGRPARILSVARDTTDLVAAQEQQRLLNGELGHRLKNILSLVQSIANQTFRQADSLAAANASLTARLGALGKATDVLTSTAWHSATLHNVIEAGLTSIDGLRDRVHLNGPDVRLDAQIALALTLALHELTTNACKYGALSNDAGHVRLTWDAADARFRFRWEETGGPTVLPPTRAGFGSRMIERSLKSYFAGETVLDFAPTGVVFRINAPLPDAGPRSVPSGR